MKLSVLSSITEVAERQLCCGCGACAFVSPERYEMVDALEHGRRPRRRRDAPDAGDDREALAACPGIGLEHRFRETHPGLIRALRRDWGPVLEVWEGRAADPEVRFLASSGGASTAIALSCLENDGMHGVLHIRSRRDAPILNETVLSTTRAELLEATGSRYAPASPCDGLHMVETAPGPCVFIGKPCDVAAARNVERLRPALRGRVGVTIAMFCAGTPTTRATLELLRRVGVDDPSRVTGVRYRGRGWPGPTAITIETPAGPEVRTLPYEEAWGEVLANHKQWRCQVCADHTGEFADIAVGDPWYRETRADEPGRSLILVRTERGRRILRAAMKAGALEARRVAAARLPESQPALLRGRGAVFGRILTCRALGVPAPRYRRLPLFGAFRTALTWTQMLRSFAGTVRRIGRRGLRRPVRIHPYSPLRAETVDTPEKTRRTAA